jgi:hypothetical protein
MAKKELRSDRTGRDFSRQTDVPDLDPGSPEHNELVSKFSARTERGLLSLIPRMTTHVFNHPLIITAVIWTHFPLFLFHHTARDCIATGFPPPPTVSLLPLTTTDVAHGGSRLRLATLLRR